MKIPRYKAKRLAILLFVVGIYGTSIGIYLNNSMILFLGGINLALAVVFLYKVKSNDNQ